MVRVLPQEASDVFSQVIVGETLHSSVVQGRSARSAVSQQLANFGEDASAIIEWESTWISPSKTTSGANSITRERIP
ncbi:hypothetical protein P6U16_27455 (plasmid) [Rhizobium sp. 32-5/1]|uniref:hypothetical protein n=1 Tax=Rhizobium sp. 32-5/1 TaxID=3019602 RepID=UPI00240D04AE|nr:hypothetical protein [Rhizobium sp. 32-5/1]WEZ86287.1 hypothetical protein P6U16_27455 [Rhizobium sp. 32-5/1]